MPIVTPKRESKVRNKLLFNAPNAIERLSNHKEKFINYYFLFTG